MRTTALLLVVAATACDMTRTVDRSGLSSFQVKIVCAGNDSSKCPAVTPTTFQCPANPLKPDLGDPNTPVDRLLNFFEVQVVAVDGTGVLKQDYNGTANVYIQFEGSVTPVRSPAVPPLATVQLQGGLGCLALTLPPAFNTTNIWVEEPMTFTADAGHRIPQGSYAAGASDPIFRPAPLISDVQWTTDPVFETSALNNKHVIIDHGDHNQPIVVTYVSANFFTVTDLGAGDLGPDNAWGSMEMYTFSQPYGVQIGSQVSHLNGSVQNFLGLPELNFPVWNVDRFDPDPVRAPLPKPHRLVHQDLLQLIPNMAAYKSGLVEVRSDTLDTWEVCALRGPALASYYKYGEWLLVKARGDCTQLSQTFNVVTTATVPNFDPIANAGKKVCHLSGILSLVVPAANINLWTITPRDENDFSSSTANIVDITAPCPP
jgi:hypothetical protein